MELAQLKLHLKEHPFRPFTLHVVDGRTFSVPHPDWVWIPPTMRHTAVVMSKGDHGFVTLDTIMISRITYDRPPRNGNGRPRGNGKPRRS